jgi:hypothetical protein
MALSDEHWAKAKRAIGLKIEEKGREFFSKGIPDHGAILEVVRENWDLLGNEAQLDTYIAARELADKTAQRAAKAAELAKLDEEIKNI